MPPPPTSGVAVTSLIFGIIGIFGSWCLFGIPSIVAIVLGHVATKKTKRGIRSGHGLAVAGLILGYFAVFPALIVSGLVITHPQALAEWVNAFIDGSSR
ncbi:DUF4190 domain-containing protein [Streptosporangium sp. NPDC000396]|uniref:DUF4190 domain-containing protein n=1 Tax=Streptosporangium sp. NPDC000396 TaxID=3366185 RepID=UPI0036A8A875